MAGSAGLFTPAEILAQNPPVDVFSPPTEDGKPVVVEAEFYLQDVDEIDVEEETFEFNGILILTWKDKRQAFDPNVMKRQEYYYMGEYQFNELSPSWYPQIILVNQSGDFETDAVMMQIKPDGTCILTQTVSAVAEADLNLRSYPFDSQNLEIVFEVLGFDNNSVELRPKNNATVTNPEEIQIPTWNITQLVPSSRDHLHAYTGMETSYSAFVYSIDLKRDPLHMVRLVMFPLIVIVILSWSVFWMDRSSLGDRINVSFIGILTAVAYQFIVSDKLPQIAYTTWMDFFVNLSFSIMCFTVVINLVVGNYDKKGNIATGDLIDLRCRWIFPIVYFGGLIISALITFAIF